MDKIDTAHNVLNKLISNADTIDTSGYLKDRLVFVKDSLGKAGEPGDFMEKYRSYTEEMEKKAYEHDVDYQLKLLWGRFVAGCVNEQCIFSPTKEAVSMQFVRGDPGESASMAGPGMPPSNPEWFCMNCEASVGITSIVMERKILNWIEEMNLDVEVI